LKSEMINAQKYSLAIEYERTVSVAVASEQPHALALASSMPPAIFVELGSIVRRQARCRALGRGVAAWAGRAGTAAKRTARPIKRRIGMVFAHPADVVAACANDGHIRPPGTMDGVQ
jgi:hypothetical protein